MRNYGVLLCLVLAFGCGSKAKKGDLTVTGSPTGAVEGQVRMILAFARPMVAKDRVDAPLPKSPVKLAPDAPIEARWSDDKTLVVVPTASLPVSTKFVVTVPGETKALDGSVLGTPYTFEFYTERLTGTIDVLGAKERAKRDQIVKLVFNQEVAAAEIEKNCSFTSKSGTQSVKLSDAPAGPSKAFSIVPAAPLALDTDYTIACKAGLRGAVGNLGIDKPLEDKLHTYGPLKFVTLDPNGTDIVPDEDLRLKLAFTNPLAEPFKITITPPVPGFPQGCHALADSPPGLSCSGQFEARTSYTLTIDGAQTDVFGQKLGKPQVLEFRTTDAQPTISMESGYFVAELKRPVVPLWTRNVSEIQVSALEVTQQNFHELAPLLEWWESKPIDFKKTKLRPRDKKIAITGTKNKWGQHSIDPTEIFGGKPGPGMYYLEVSSAQVDKGAFSDGGRQKVLVNFTDIGVVSKLSPTRGLVWATQLSTGKPLPSATVIVRDGAGKTTFTGTTDADGVAVLPGTGKLGADTGGGDEGGDEEGEGESTTGLRIYVQHQADWTMVNPNASGGLSTWAYNVAVDRDTGPTKLRGFMHTDRGLYRPGDTVHVKGLARITKLGEPLSLPNTGKKVSVEVSGPQGKTVTTTDARLSAFGGFWFDVELPGDSRLGDYTVTAKLDGGTFTRTFSVEEYRAATFEVTGKTKENLVVRRGDVKGTISANYFYGAPVRTGEVDVVVHSRKRRVRFDAHKDFDFTDDRDYESYSYYESEEAQTMVTEDHVALDAKGNAAFSFSVGPNDVYSDADLLIRASVTSPSNEVISKSFTIPYFKAKKYFGIKAPGYFLDVKKPAKFQLVSVGADGKLVDAIAKVKVTRRDWNCVWEDWGYRGSYACKDITQVIVDKKLTFAGGKADLDFTPASGGDYLVVVEGENDKQEAAPAAQRLYAWGDGGGSWRSDDTLSFDIAADKQEYKAGDTATLILKTDLAQATGLMTIERDGVIEKRLIQITPTQKHLTVPITAAYAPNVYVSVALVQGRTGDGPRGKPRMRMGIVNLPVRPEDNRLTVSVETDKKEYRPGAQVTATVKVTDAQGKPVSAEVSITAADEGVLSLIGYQTPDPVPSFFAPWGLGVSSATQFEYIRDIPAPNVERPASGGDAAGTLRSRFVASAVWVPGAVTNAAGIATVQFAAPDNLTAFRMMAVAADRTYRFGSADKRFTVSKPLQLHSALPRFVSLGDSLHAGVVVHNETKAAGSATVKLVSDEHVTIAGNAEQTVNVAAGGRVPVLFDLKPAAVGTAALKFTVTMGSETDGVKLDLPVQHPSRARTNEVAFGATKDDKTIAIALPAEAIPTTAELVISVDPDGLAGIEDGLRDLIGYPYGCLEQTTSKVIPMIAVRDLAESAALDGLTGKALDGFVKAGITKINRHQTAYGGFSLWPGGEPEAYYTAYALWGLHLAKQAGYPVDETRIEEALGYLANDGANPDHDTPYYSEAGNLGAQAFALYVRALYKDKAAGAAATTLLKQAQLPIYGKAYVARALAASVGAKDPAVVKLVGELATLANTATKTEALIVEPEDDMDWYMSTSLRTTSAVLSALVELDPKNAAIKPLVRSIMKNRRTVDWWDTQSNLYSLLALSQYAKSVAGGPPSVTVAFADKNLVTGTLAGKQKLRVITTPLTGNGELSIKPRGEVHYSVSLRYRTKPDALKPESKGIELVREYLDEAGKPKTTFTVGDVVVVKLKVKAPDDSAHLMVSDALPGGFEALNTRLATVGTAGVTQSKVWWGNYREMHDERVDFASEYNYTGNFEYVYSIRAIAVGKFARPPATAELMYEPTKHARTGLDYLEIKPK
jgi:alpha-2-macroglobulin